MFLYSVSCNNSLYEEAKNFFISHWRSELLYKTPESLIGAYYVTKEFHKLWYSDFSFKDWIFNHKDLFFSTSHKNWEIVIAIDNKKVAIDLEYIKPISNQLLKNTSLLEDFSPLECFYIQRCCKECLIKYLDLKFEDINNIKLYHIKDHETKINSFKFNYLWYVKYKNSIYQILMSLNKHTIITILT